MSLNQRQFNILKEMAIPLWQLKANANTQESEKETPNHHLYVDDKPIVDCQLFIDILALLDLTASEVDTTKTPINLGLYAWQFHIENSMSFSQNTLTTPPLAQIQHSPALKKQLWQLLSQHIY